MSPRVGLGAVTAIAAMLVLPQDGEAAWQICNKTPSDAYVAIAYVNPQDVGFISKGWWKVRACGGCSTVLSMGTTSDPRNVFYRAEFDDGSVIEGDSMFCASESEFRKRSTARCSDRRAFLHKEINLENWTTNLVGRSASGRQCID